MRCFGPVLLLPVACALLRVAVAQDPLKLPGKNYTVVFENSQVTVIRAHYGPHEKIPVHDHTSFSTVFVYLSGSGSVKINHEEDGKIEPVTRPPDREGSVPRGSRDSRAAQHREPRRPEL